MNSIGLHFHLTSHIPNVQEISESLAQISRYLSIGVHAVEEERLHKYRRIL